MKLAILTLPLLAMSSYAVGWDNRYEIQTSPYGSSFGGGRDIEMRQRYDYDPGNRYRGQVDSDGSVRMRNLDGDRVRGNVDSDGYGRLRDQHGNTWRVRPR